MASDPMVIVTGGRCLGCGIMITGYDHDAMFPLRVAVNEVEQWDFTHQQPPIWDEDAEPCGGQVIIESVAAPSLGEDRDDA